MNFDIRFSPSGAKPLEVTLATMERTQLVRANEDLEHTFSFKHALVQESAYGSLIKHDRQRLHRLVGEALERLYPEALDENAALLAHHFENAQVPDRALFYLQRAAERARRANAHREQIALLTRALALAERSGTPELRADLLITRAEAFRSITQWQAGLQDIEKALTLVPPEQTGQRARAMVALALIKIWLANAAGAREAALEARALAEAAHRDDLVVNALSALAGAETVEGNLQPVAEYFDEALARAGAMRSTSLSQGMEMTALAQYWIGNYAVSLERNRQAVERAREVADTVTIMRGLSNIGMALVGCGQYGEALATFEEARRFGQAHGLGAWLARQLAIEGGFHLELYDYMGAQALAEQAQELAQAFKFIVAIVSPGIDLLFNYARSGHLARATEVEALVRRSLPGVTGAHLWLLALRFAQARAELAAARWQWREALSLADESLALSRHHGRVKYQVLALQTRALARAHLGQTDLALVDARAAIDLARTTGDPAMFLRAALTSLHLAGDDALAGEARDAARRIAASLPPGGLCERFEAFVTDQL